MVGAIRREFVQTGTVSATEHGLARAWQKFTTSLQDLVSIRRVSDAAVGLVSIEELNVRRHHLQTLLFAARLAALRADETDYTASVTGARDWLGQYFDGTSPATQAAAAELGDLAQRHVSPSIPDISGSVKLLRGRMP
jgi:uroporphyrin-3 C-methyltransferase